MRVQPHTHPCQSCGTPTQCDAMQDGNHDGWPAVICPAFHLSGGVINPDFLCDRCRGERAS